MLIFVHSLIVFINFIVCSINRKEEIIINLLGPVFYPLLERDQLLSVMKSGEKALDSGARVFFATCHMNNFPLFLGSLIKTLEKIDESKLLAQSDESAALKLTSLLVGLLRSDIDIEEDELDILNSFLAFLIRIRNYDPNLTLYLIDFRWEYRIRKYKLFHYYNLGLYQDSGLRVIFTLKQSFEDLRLAVGVPNTWNSDYNLYGQILRYKLLSRYINLMNPKYGLFTSSNFNFSKVISGILSANPARDKLFKDIVASSLKVHFLCRDSIKFEATRPYNQDIEFKNGRFRIPPILKGFLKYIILSHQNIPRARAEFLHTVVMLAVSEFLDSIYLIYELFYETDGKVRKVCMYLDLMKEININFDLIFESLENDEDMQLFKSYLLKTLNMQIFFMSNCQHGQHLPNLLFLENFSELSPQSIEYQIREYLRLMPIWMGLSIKRSPFLTSLLSSNSKNDSMKNLILFIHTEIAVAFRILSVLEDKSGLNLRHSDDGWFFTKQDIFTFASFSILCWVINEKNIS
jgi:hypothetical protein